MYNVMHAIRVGEVLSNNGEPQCQSSSHSRSPPSKKKGAMPSSSAGQVHLQAGRAEAAPEGSNHVRTTQRWVKMNGERQATTKQQAVRPWWKTDPAGQVVMSVKFGAKPIEFEKGKAGIAVPSKDKLPAVIDILIAAVRAGELDDLFSQAAKTGSIGKARKTACRTLPGR